MTPPKDTQREETLALIAGAQRGDPAALRRLITRLMPVLQARVRRRLRSRPDRRLGSFDEQDLVQEIWLSLVKDGAAQLARWDPERGATLEGYVGMVAERVLGNVAQQVGALKRRADADRSDASPELLVASGPDPEQTADLKQTCAALGAHLEQELPAKGQTILRYLYTDGLAPDEVAEVMGVNRQVVYNWQHKIRKLAQGFLERVGV